MKTKTFDVGIGWGNAVDVNFIRELKKELRKKKLTFKEVTFITLREDFQKIKKGELHFKTFIDRSSDDFGGFLLVAYLLASRGTHVVNDPESVTLYSGKADLYYLLKKAKLPLPKTFIIDPKQRSQSYFKKIVKELGIPFVLNPSYGGAGEGVVLNAVSAEKIAEYTKENDGDYSIAHEYLVPAVRQKRFAWFRPIYVCGTIIPLWWDQQNHYYQEFGVSAFEKKTASVLATYVKKIARITGLELFSVEVVLDERGTYLVIDYTNHPIDLNTRDTIPDGLPVNVLRTIVTTLVASLKKKSQ